MSGEMTLADGVSPSCQKERELGSQIRRYLREGKSLRAAASLCGITPGEAEGFADDGSGATGVVVSDSVDDVRALARQATADAIQTLIDVARHSGSDAARVAAANALLERGHGKVAGMAVEVGEGLSKVRVEIIG